jgi:hypothetical protein
MTTTAQEYREFGAREARGRSALYEEFSYGVAGDRDLLALIDRLPPPKRQPNLLYAAVRHVSGTPADFAALKQAVLDNSDAVLATMLARRTQTNECGRCTGLYPLLSALPQPLALIEVGASAGLCLYPDRYGYSFAAPNDSPVQLTCDISGPGPATFGPIRVAWRAGIDLNPLDVTDPADVSWLRTLVWPGQTERLARLDAAIGIARTDPPRLVRGDLNEQLPALAASAPSGATLVIFHTAVLHYVPEPGRSAFIDLVKGLDAVWISQEGPEVLPGVQRRLPPMPPSRTQSYILSQDERPRAVTALHGGQLTWLPPV